MRLLIIEDQVELANLMKATLTNYSYVVDVAHTGMDGELKAFDNSYDAILLDLNLPDKDGLDVLAFLRSQGITSPILILTARSELNQRIKGFDLGSDDFIIKPFEFEELHARIQAVVRRFYGRSNPIIQIEALAIHPKTRRVFIHEQEILLSTKEFDILEFIANNYPNLVSSEELAEHVYDENFDPFSSVIRVHIANIKRKLVLDGEPILRNVKGRGYYLCLRQVNKLG